jgi:hypothetical protein
MARTLRLTLSDGSLDVVLHDNTLAFTLAVVVAAKREAINARRAGQLLIVEGNAAGGYAVKLGGNVTEALADIAPTT